MATGSYALYGRFVLDTDEAIKEVRKLTGQLEKGLKGGTQQARSMFGQMKGLARIVGAASVIGWAFEAQYAMRQLVSETITLGGELDHIRTGTEDLSKATGINLTEMAAKVREASDNTLTLSESLRQVNQSLLLGGGPGIVENLPELFEIARYNARAMGIDVQRALESMVTGLGRVSPRWLDNLGVIIDTRKEYTKWADENDRMVSSLTEAEQRLILINAIIEKYGALVAAAGDNSRTAAEDFEALGSSFRTMLAQMGEAILNNPAVQGMINSMIEIINYQVQWNELTEAQRLNLVEMLGAATDFQKEQEKAIRRTFKRPQGDILREANTAFGAAEIAATAGDVEEFQKQINLWADAMERLNGERPTNIMADMARLFGSGATGASMLGITEATSKASEEAIKRQRDAFDEAKKEVTSYIEKVDSLGLSMISSGKAQTSSIKAITDDYKAIYDSLLQDPEFLSASTEERAIIMAEGIYMLTQELEALKEATKDEVDIEINYDSDALSFLKDVNDELERMSGRGLAISDALNIKEQAEGFAVAMENLRLPKHIEDWLYAQEAGRLKDAADVLLPPTAEEIAREATQAAKEAQRAYEEWVKALESDVEAAVLSDLKVTKDDFLPGRKDAPLEAVRRLRDIVNLGLKSPWAEYFEIPPEVLAEGEEAVKRWAYDLSERGADLRDISLIDKDAFLRELEDLKLARQERANVMSQLVQWAIDAGLADNEKEAKSLAKDYLGVPSAEGLQDGLEDEIEDYKFADFVTGAFDDDMEKNVSKYETSGKSMANAMFAGWEEQMNENISGYQYSDPNSAPNENGLPSQYNIPIQRGGPLR